MAIGLEDKKAIVAEVNETATSALSLVIADARGVTVDGMTALRKEARENSGDPPRSAEHPGQARTGRYRIRVCQRLAGRSLPVRIFDGRSRAPRLDSSRISRRKTKNFEVKALAVSGQMLGAEQLDVLAKLPTRDQALSMLMSVMKAPATKLVQTMNEVPGKLVRTLAAVRDQKEAAA